MIRELTINDYDITKKLVYQIHNLHYKNRPDIYTKDNPLPFIYFKKVIEDKSSIVLGYEMGGKIIGVLIASIQISKDIPIFKKRTIYYIEDIVVDRNYRQTGIGKKLYNYLQDIAYQKKVNAIELNVLSFNKRAIMFYKSLGMSEKKITMEQIFK